LGGDSILAIKLVNVLYRKLKYKIDLASIFKFKTIAGIVDNIKGEDLIVIPKADVKNKFTNRLSFAQERLWFIEQYEGGSYFYNIPMVIKLNNDVKIKILEEAIRNTILRHSVLHSLIKINVDGEAYQQQDTVGVNKLKFIKYKVSGKEEVAKLIDDEAKYVFNLAEEYPLRVSIITDSQNKSKYLSVVVHHMAFDGWSVNIFYRDICRFYEYNIDKSDKLNLEVLDIEYRDFAIWQRGYLTGSTLDKQLNYWVNNLSDMESLNLPIDKVRPHKFDYIGDTIGFKLDQDVSDKLRYLARQLNISLYSLTLSCFNLLLSSYSNQEDIVIGTPIANRHHNQLVEIVGFFVNTLVIRSKVEKKRKITEYIKNVNENIIQAQLHQDLPFEKLVSELKVVNDESRNPIFQVLFSLQNFNLDTDITNNNKVFNKSDIEVIDKIAKFDLTVMLSDSDKEINGTFNYATSLFNHETIKNFINTYKHILNQIAKLRANSETKLSDLTYVAQKEYKKQIYTWNNTKQDYPQDKTIYQLFEEQVIRTPDNIAVVYEDRELSYQELNRRSNQLAHYLRSKYDLHGDDLMALCLDRSEYMLISILGVLKAGCAYVPIDPSYPLDRISYILDDTKAKCLLVNEANVDKINRITKEYVVIDNTIIANELSNQKLTNPKIKITSKNLAYVIYTSGTTGKPKGVIIEHRGVVNHLSALKKVYEIESLEKILLLSNYVFDASVGQIFLALFNGGKLVIADDNTIKNSNKLENLIFKQEISHLVSTPNFLEILDINYLSKVKRIVSGGSVLPIKLLNKLMLNSKTVINEYGPTEVTITSLIMINGLYIGKPIANTSVYILDNNLRPLPIGAIGELYIGGDGLARGYLNRDDLTTERFIANPFASEEDKLNNRNSRIYKTGDLVRYREDGNIEYIGRNDDQVKIRGFRIELAEIENVLGGIEGVKQAVVITRVNQENGSKYLVAYYVAVDKIDEELIRNELGSKLPEYMVPSSIVYLTSMPLTINGKLDKRSLPEVSFSDSSKYVAPRNELEGKICGIYAAVLGLKVESVGINDNFFNLGGDSIISIQVVGKLRQKLGISVNVKDIFTYKSVSSLYDGVIVKTLAKAKKVNLLHETGELRGEVELLEIQRWFFRNVAEGLFKEYNHWNQSFLIKVGKLDEEILRLSLVKLVEYHDALRFKYGLDQESECGYRQYYAGVDKFELIHIYLDKVNSLEDELTRLQGQFNIIDKRELYRFGYITGYEDGSSRIFVCAHHLVIDAVSWRILADDLGAIYTKLVAARDLGNLEQSMIDGTEVLLGVKGTSYRQWVGLVKDYGFKHKQELSYWQDLEQKVLISNAKLLKLVKNEYSNNQSYMELDKAATTLLLTVSNRAYHTQINDLLLTAFGLALSSITASSNNYITLEGHGREEIAQDIDITRTVGWFTSMYPVSLEVNAEDIGQSIVRVKEHLRGIELSGIGYGALCEYSNLPRISFNYLGQFDSNGGGDNSWGIINEGSGISVALGNRSKDVISVNGLVSGGKLSFSINSKLDKRHVDKLAKEFKQRLEEVIGYTSAMSRSYLSRSDVAKVVSQEYLDKIQGQIEVENVYIANSLQQGFIYHALNQGVEDSAYIVQLEYEYNQKVDEKLLQMAWQSAIDRYASLRLRFAWDEEIVQIIDKHQKLWWQYLDISYELDQEEIIANVLKEDRSRRYDLGVGNLIRVYLIKQGEDKYRLIQSNHHSILDGWSNSIVLNHVHETYVRLSRSKGKYKTVLDAIKVDSSYEIAQSYLQRHADVPNGYWKQEVGQVEERASLNLLVREDKSQVQLAEYKLLEERKEGISQIDGNEYKQLVEFSRKNNVTINSILQYAWHKLISVYTNAKTTIVGTIVSGRNLPIDDIDKSVGLYINTLPLIMSHDGDVKVIDAIHALQDKLNDMNSNSWVNLAKLQHGVRLFESLLVYENYPQVASNDSASIKVKMKGAIEELDYPLAIVGYEAQNKLVINIKYAGELFAESTITTLLSKMALIIGQVISKPQVKQHELTYLNQEEYKKQIYTWNNTKRDYPQDKTIYQLFEEQVVRTPDNIAVVYEDRELSYQELNRRSNQLAHYLRSKYDLNGDDLIALCLDRSEYMLISILGVLKAGCAYVPIDPSYPEDRISYILDDTKAKCLLVNEANVDKIKEITKKYVVINSEGVSDELVVQSQANPKVNITSKNLAYVIYTSGTTGKPKGVLQQHNNVHRLLTATNDWYHFNSNDTWTLFHSYVFDFSVWEIWGALCYGGKLVIPSYEKTRDLEQFYELCLKQGVTVLNQTPTAFYQFIDIALNKLTQSRLTNLRYVIFGGEALNISLLSEWIKEYGYTGPTLINGAVENLVYEKIRDKHDKQ